MRWWFLVLVGCGRIGFDPIETHDEDGTHSGRRLKVIWNRFDNDLQQPLGIYDSELDMRCRLATVNGEQTCIPDSRGTIFFDDASCTRPVYAAPACEVEDRYIFTGTRAYERGASRSAVHVYSLLGTSCLDSSSTRDVFDMGPELPLDKLATATIVEEPTAGRLAQEYYTSSDGFRISGLVRDHTLDTSCTIVAFPEGAYTVFPEPIATASYFLDAACSQLAGASVQPIRPDYALQNFPATCSSAVLPIIDEITPPAVYQMIGQTCTMSSAGVFTGRTFYSLGAPMPPLMLSQQIGSVANRRVQTRYAAGEGGTYRMPQQFDSALQADCFPALLTDGSRRCVPVGAGYQPFFSDAACMQRAEVAYISWTPPCTPRPKPPRFAYRATGTCQNTFEVYDVTSTEVSGPFYALAQDGVTCNPLMSSAQAMVAFYVVAGPADSSQFASVDVITDP